MWGESTGGGLRNRTSALQHLLAYSDSEEGHALLLAHPVHPSERMSALRADHDRHNRNDGASSRTSTTTTSSGGGGGGGGGSREATTTTAATATTAKEAKPVAKQLSGSQWALIRKFAQLGR
eukprot:4570086-Pyramimonas_sp.AAC.4